jgi:hypothetical protein
MGATRRKNTRPSKDQVRAWLTTVIAPIGRALAVERDRVARGNWSFRCETRDFEFLWPIRKMVAVQYLPNLEQLLRHRRELQKGAEEHDEALAALLVAANRAYDNVVHSDGFRALTTSASVPEDDRRYLAEYMINGIRDLSSYYSHHDLWTREGGRFLALRDTPEQRDQFRSLGDAGRRFAGVVDRLGAAVNRLQSELADSYKLPPVESANARN